MVSDSRQLLRIVSLSPFEVCPGAFDERIVLITAAPHAPASITLFMLELFIPPIPIKGIRMRCAMELSKLGLIGGIVG